MKTDQEWEERSQPSFYEILRKLNLDELKRLTFIFECYPSYCGEVDKDLCIRYIWSRLREWRLGKDDAKRLRDALWVLKR